MNRGSRTLVMLAAGVVLLMAATLVADVVLSSNAMRVTGNPPGASGALIYAELQGAGSGEVAIMGYSTGTGVAVHGAATKNAGVVGTSTYSYGLSGTSTYNSAIYGSTSRGDNNYGLFTLDNVYSLNFHKVGAIMQVAQNTGAEALQPGDVVTFRGIRRLRTGDEYADEPLWARMLGAPVVQVAKASVVDGTGVAGVVFSRYQVMAEPMEQTTSDEKAAASRSRSDTEPPAGDWPPITPPGSVQPGELMLVVVHGPAEVRVEPYLGSVEPGDLLVAGDISGYAAKALVAGDGSAPPTGAVFAKALEAVDPDRGTIYVYVTLQ
jgi:hypothetical protein